MSSGFDMEEILELPEKISKTQKEILEITDDITIAKNDMSITEARITTDIITEINPDTDKPRYSNETARKNELQTRLRKDDDYKEKQATYNGHKASMELKQVKLEFLNNRHRAISHALRYMELGLESDSRIRRIEALLKANLDYVKERAEAKKE